MAVVAELGRLPEAGEFVGTAAVVARFGSLKRAFALVRRVTGEAEWEVIRQRRTEDLLVYMALARFGKRPALSQLPCGLRADIRTRPQFYIGHSLFDIGYSVAPLGVLALGERPTRQTEKQNVEYPTRNVQCRSAEQRS